MIDWCKKKMEETKRIVLIERNPFEDIEWLRNKTLIQINVPFSRADTHGIVYDSATNALYEYKNGKWSKIEESWF